MVTGKAAAVAARSLVRRALKGALATRDAGDGTPYASMILLATAIDGAPLTLISTLARHTRNLLADPAASIMIDTSNTAGDAASGGRVSLMGRFKPCPTNATRQRFIARHPDAAAYADFADFSFWRLQISTAHAIEGFGRITPLAGADLQPSCGSLAAFAADAPSALSTLQRRWPIVTGIDPEGVDVRLTGTSDRLAFATTAATAEAAYDAAANCLVAYCAAQ